MYLLVQCFIKKMPTIIKKSFGVNLKILTTLGLYPPEEITAFYIVRSYLMYFIFTYPVPVLGILHLIFKEEMDTLRLGDDAFAVAETGCQIVKLLPFVINGNRIKMCIHYLEDPIFATENNMHSRIMEQCITICKRNSNVFFFFVVGGLISWVVRPFFENERRLPVDIWLFFSITGSSRAYFFTFLFVLTGAGYVAIASAAIDPLIGGLACLAAGQLQILKDNLQNLSSGKQISTEPERNIILKNQIKECIKRHNATLVFVKEYEQCFSLSVFSQFIGSVIVLCFCCLQLSKVPPMTFTFMSIVATLSIMLVQIYFYCYYGTILHEESNSLTNAVYMGVWYEYDIHSRKDLILLMERSKKPIIITAGKILDLSVTTFAEILKKSYSLLAVFKKQ